MHSIIESTNCGGPSAWSLGHWKSPYISSSDRGTNCLPWIGQKLKLLLMKLLGTSLFFVVLHFLEKSSVILNVNVKQNKEKKKKHTVKKRETKLFQSHSRISISPVFGRWHIFIADCMSVCHQCVSVTTGYFQLFGMMDLGQSTLSCLMQ